MDSPNIYIYIYIYIYWVLKCCAIITPTNTTHYIHYKHFKRDRHVDVCEIYFLCFGGMIIFKSLLFIAYKCVNTLLWGE